MRPRQALFPLLIALAGLGLAHADIDSVYAPAPPADAAFVRFLNLSGRTASATFERGGQVRLDAGAGASRYEIVPGGRLKITFSGKAARPDVALEIPVRHYATCVLGPDARVRLLRDEADSFNLLKARLRFYNLSRCAQASLVALTPDEVPVFTGVGQDTPAARPVNPVRTRFLARCDDQRLASPPLPAPALRAGQRHSLFLIDAGSSVRLIEVADTTAPAAR